MPVAITARVDLAKVSDEIKATEKKFVAAARKRIRTAINESGADLVSAMRGRASWSSRIPGAVKLSVRFGAKASSVRIEVDHNKAPHARALELGNSTTFDESVINKHGGFKIVNGKKVAVNKEIYKNMRRVNMGVGRALKHPVWGKGDRSNGWSSMALRPFFFPAVEARQSAITNRFEAVVDEVARDSGFQ
jgi:hypothetical protein